MSSHFINLYREVIQSPVKSTGKFFPLVSAGFALASKKKMQGELQERIQNISFQWYKSLIYGSWSSWDTSLCWNQNVAWEGIGTGVKGQ